MKRSPNYVVVNGTSYPDVTPWAVIDVLEAARASGQRIRVHYGDSNTGQDWGDIHDVRGTVGRSMGPVKVPLLIANSRSMGGGAILTGAIVRIRTTRKPRRDLYRHPSYTPPKLDDSGMNYSERERREFEEEEA